MAPAQGLFNKVPIEAPTQEIAGIAKVGMGNANPPGQSKPNRTTPQAMAAKRNEPKRLARLN